jgi:hypothetical protein
VNIILPWGEYELSPEEVAAIHAAVDALPPMSDDALDRIALLFAAMDAEDRERRAPRLAADQE